MQVLREINQTFDLLFIELYTLTKRLIEHIMNTEKKFDSRKALLEAARKLFTEKGYDAVSTRELAESSGVNLAAIQYHFGSKEALFIETLRHLMAGSSCANSQETLTGDIPSPHAAAVRLGTFITELLASFLRTEGPQPCRLMFREIFSSASENDAMFRTLVNTVVNDYIKPVDLALIRVLKMLSPKCSADELALIVHSIIGQCSFYITHGPFIQLLRQKQFQDSPNFEDVAQHITQFTLRALNYSASPHETVVKEVLESYAHKNCGDTK